jgi:hypothetical protein
MRAAALGALLALGSLVGAAPLRAAEYSPTPRDTGEIDRLTGVYFGALERADYATAYALFTPEMRGSMLLGEFTRQSTRTREQVGELLARKRTQVGWQLDPPDAAGPGLYVAVDFVTDYANAAHTPEYLIWYRAPGPTISFQLLRHEANYHVDAAKGDSPRTSAPEPLKESSSNATGFASVAAARAALTSREGVEVRNMDDGWLVVNDPGEKAVWSFAPAGHPAYPAVVKRTVRETVGKVVLDMSALCEAAKRACDRLLREFQEMNRKIGESAGGK